ncbi:hypothetical protein JHW43_003925 [Diplocarpon mali]|nr:hypothetical protein JHW43_003925 [Diplocarpon mali]
MADLTSKPPLGRKNTLQRMLDLEQENKLSRMKAATFPLAPSDAQPTATPHTSTAPPAPPPRSIRRHHLPGQARDPAMTTPTASLAVQPPPPKLTATAGPPATHVASAGRGLAPRRPEHGDLDSDVSSICQSPGWEDYSGKKRRKTKEEEKERRKQEKEGNGRRKPEGRKGEGRNRLSKPPPVDKRLSQASVVPDRSASAPTVPTLLSMARPGAEGPGTAVSDKSRSRSADLGLRGFIASSHAVPVRWKSSQASPAAPAPARQGPSPRMSFSRKAASVDDGGFIGGLKLEQHIMREQRAESGDDVPGAAQTDRNSPPPRAAGALAPRASRANPVLPATSPYDETTQAPRRRDGPPAGPAAAIRHHGIHDQPAEGSMPVMRSNARKIRRSSPPATASSPWDDDDEARSPPPLDRPGATSRQTTLSASGPAGAGPKQGPLWPAPSPTSSNALPAQARGAAGPRPAQTSYPPDSRGRASYVRHQRQEGKERALHALQRPDADAAVAGATRPRSRRGSFVAFVRSRSRSRNLDPEAGAPRDGGGKVEAPRQKPPDPSRFLDEKDVVTQLRFELHTKAWAAAPTRTRSSSKGPGFRGFKSAARGVFSRHSIAAPESPSTESFATARESRSSSNAPSSPRASLEVGMASESSPRKDDDKHLARPPSPLTGRDLGRRAPGPDGASESQAESAGRVPADPVHPGSSGRHSHSSCSRTDSSEGSSTLDEVSSLTTPTASRPSSQKDHSSTNGPRSTSAESPAHTCPPAAPGVPGPTPGGTCAAPLGERAGRPDSRCRTALDVAPAEDEDRTSTPTGPRHPADWATAHPDPPTPEGRPPEIQDLSFLPTLKHQALARASIGGGQPADRPSDRVPDATQSQAVATFAPPGETPLQPLGRPPPIPALAAKREGSSTASPASSQYLQTARLTIPRAPKTTFPPGPHHQTGPDPIAKMLVVCCSCKYFHDMPSKVYACMVKPDDVVTDQDLGVSGIISTSVKCPWCGHGMRTTCCAGYAAVVYLSERLH